MANTLQNGRATITTWGDEIHIRIPTKTKIFSTLFMLFWLGAWFIGEISVLAILSEGDANPFFIFWLGAWTVGGGFVILSVLWNIAGAEKITIGSKSLQIKKAVFGIGFNREYALASINNVRIISEAESMFRRNTMAEFSQGPIFFDYGLKTVKFGQGIDEAEARYLLKILQERGLSKETE
ncbi:MAG: hypothetical protein LBR56_06940 [Sporomusaceae bacterium]|jgi:hypothetical protein|nr:hypothetical protein [Sporomusaceae bacterium]